MDHVASNFCPACRRTKLSCRGRPECHKAAALERKKAQFQVGDMVYVDLDEGSTEGKILEDLGSGMFKIRDPFGGEEVVPEEALSKPDLSRFPPDRIESRRAHEQCPACKQPKLACKSTPACWREAGKFVANRKKAQDTNYELEMIDVEQINSAIGLIVKQWDRRDTFNNTIPAGAFDGMSGWCQRIMDVIENYRGW